MSLTVVLNFVFFQALWFSCVVGAGAYGWWWLAVASMVPISILGWWAGHRNADFIIAGIALCVGLVIDNLWVVMGILTYPDHALAPYWIAILWVGLGLTINHSMALFRDHTLLGSLVVGAFAPVTYLAGERFGAVTVNELYLTPVISVAWFVAFYAMAKLALRLVSAQAPASPHGQSLSR